MRTPTLIVPYSITGGTKFLYIVCFPYYYKRQIAYPYANCPLYSIRVRLPKLHSFVRTQEKGLERNWRRREGGRGQMKQVEEGGGEIKGDWAHREREGESEKREEKRKR